MNDYPDTCKRFCGLKQLEKTVEYVAGPNAMDNGEATDSERLWQQVRALQLQLKGFEEKLYALADTLYMHEHGHSEKVKEHRTTP